jgi:hypothetical protein
MLLLPPMSPDRDALRNTLRSSLSDVLLDIGFESGRNVHPMMHTNDNPQSLALRQQALRIPAMRAAGAFDSPFLLSPQQSLFSQNLGLAALRAGSPSLRPYRSMGLSADGILLAIAAASERSKLLEQAKATLIEQQIAEENKRILLQKTYLDLVRKGMPAKHERFLQKIPVVPQPEAASSAISAEQQALMALGSNLRSRNDPYFDVADVKVPDPGDSTLRRTRGGVSDPFPEKLHRMLEEVEKQGNSQVVSFYSHGRAFGVHDMDRFVSEVMPKFFKQSKWNSFARQLNLYGFIRVTSGPDAGGYYHELFLKGRPNLCLHMRRAGVPQGEDRRKFRPKNKNVEPDFYSMNKILASAEPR